jgi:epsin
MIFHVTMLFFCLSFQVQILLGLAVSGIPDSYSVVVDLFAWDERLRLNLCWNLAAKVNPLADLGIQLTDASLRNELWGGSDNKKKDERKSIYGASSMGQAMGVGSGLGRAGASVLPSPPLPPPAAMNVRMGMAPGVAPVTGMGPQMGLNPGMGMGVNLAMGMAPNMAPNMNMGMGQGVPNMWMGRGGYANQQYAGYR